MMIATTVLIMLLGDCQDSRVLYTDIVVDRNYATHLYVLKSMLNEIT